MYANQRRWWSMAMAPTKSTCIMVVRWDNLFVRPSVSKRGCVCLSARPSVSASVRQRAHFSDCPSVRSSGGQIIRPSDHPSHCKTGIFERNTNNYNIDQQQRRRQWQRERRRRVQQLWQPHRMWVNGPFFFILLDLLERAIGVTEAEGPICHQPNDITENFPIFYNRPVHFLWLNIWSNSRGGCE